MITISFLANGNAQVSQIKGKGYSLTHSGGTKRVSHIDHNQVERGGLVILITISLLANGNAPVSQIKAKGHPLTHSGGTDSIN